MEVGNIPSAVWISSRHLFPPQSSKGRQLFFPIARCPFSPFSCRPFISSNPAKGSWKGILARSEKSVLLIQSWFWKLTRDGQTNNFKVKSAKYPEWSVAMAIGSLTLWFCRKCIPSPQTRETLQRHTFFFTCLEQESISFALLWYQSVSSSMEGVAVRNPSSSGASSYRKLSSSNRFWSSTALKKTLRERGGCVACLLGLSNKHEKKKKT